MALTDLGYWEYPPLIKEVVLFSRSKTALAFALGLSAVLSFLAWKLMTLASTSSWLKVSCLVGVWLYFIAAALNTITYLRPWVSLPVRIAVSTDGIELLDQRQSYAFIPRQDILRVRQRRFSVREFPLFNPFFGEITEVECNGPVSRFYVTPMLSDYSRFASALDLLVKKPKVSARSSFQINKVSFGLALMVPLLACLGAAYLWRMESGTSFKVSFMPLIIFAFSLVALVSMLLLSPLLIRIDPTGVSLRFLTHTKRIPREELRGFVAFQKVWGGDYNKVLRHSKGTVYIHRSFYNRFEEMTQAIDSLMESSESKTWGQ